jgi:hypothetical protein
MNAMADCVQGVRQRVSLLTLSNSSVGTTSICSFFMIVMTFEDGCFSAIAVCSDFSCSSSSFFCMLTEVELVVCVMLRGPDADSMGGCVPQEQLGRRLE